MRVRKCVYQTSFKQRLFWGVYNQKSQHCLGFGLSSYSSLIKLFGYYYFCSLSFCLQELGFVRLFSKVQTAHFKMRSNKLMLDEEFYVSLMELPEQYHFGTYSRFFNTFGTHYVTEGTMGGTLEYVVVLNKTAMAESSTVGFPLLLIKVI